LYRTADVTRYVFIVWNSHPLSSAGVTGALVQEAGHRIPYSAFYSGSRRVYTGWVPSGSSTGLPHSGQTPLTFPVRLYPHAWQYPGGMRRERNHRMVRGTAKSRKANQNGTPTCQHPRMPEPISQTQPYPRPKRSGGSNNSKPFFRGIEYGLVG